MFVVTVRFQIVPDKVDPFRSAVAEQAKNSLDLESQCLVFDVCVDTDDKTEFFLYEKYETRAAFNAHLGSDHFKAFDKLVATWVHKKAVKTWIETEDKR